LGLLSFFQIIHYYYILLFIIVGWVYMGSKLYAEYRNKIRDKLESEDTSIKDIDIVRESVIFNIQQNLRSKVRETVIFSFKLLEKINPNYVPPSINTLMKHKDENIRDFAQNSMNALRGVSVSDRYIISATDQNEKANRVMLTPQEISYLLKTGEISKRRLAKLCRSEDEQDRQYGAELIGHMDSEDSLSFMIELLNDIEHNVRLAAIATASKRFNKEVINGLVQNLGSSIYSNVAKSALFAIGGKALPVLDNAFYKAGQDVQVMLRIIEIMGRIGGKMAMEMLWNKIDYPDKLISFQVLDSLSETGFKASLSQITRIKFAIVSNISDIAWNLAAYLEIPDNQNTRQLKTALNEENEHDVRHIYTLLSMLYDAKSIYLIKQNLESGTSEGITYAIELLDVLLAEDLKQKIIPILDDISVADRVRKLQVFYPRAKLSTQLSLKFLINRDFTQSNRWTKACAIYQIGRLKIKEFNYDLIANLFNPDMMVKEMSAWGLYNIDKEQYYENIERLLPEEKARLDEMVLSHSLSIETGNLTFEKVRFLQSMEAFRDVTGLLLSYVADDMQTKLLNEGETMALAGDMTSYFIIIRSGKVNHYEDGAMIRTMESKDFIGERLENQQVEGSGQLVALEDARLMLINKDRYYELLSDNLSFAQSVIKYMSA
ncbi:MAG: HEAT repeat domain-containing protein, partial [Bacteroidota bacterium]